MKKRLPILAYILLSLTPFALKAQELTPTASESVIQITFHNLKDQPYSGAIKLEHLHTHEVYSMQADARGVVIGKVPTGGHYWISTELSNKIEKVSLPKKENQRYFTAIQLPFYNDGQLMPTSNSAVLKMTVFDEANNKISHQPVFLKEQNSGKSRKMETNQEGVINTLIPKGHAFDVLTANKKKIGVVDSRKLEMIQLSVRGY